MSRTSSKTRREGNAMTLIRICAAIAALALGALAGPLAAQTWPERPVTIIVPFPPGGSTDVIARFVAKGLGEKLGQQFVVENRAGAGGNIGGDQIAKAAPNGYTLGLGSSGPLANNKLLYANLPYDPVTAFTPIIMVGEIPVVIAISTKLQARTLKEFTDLARSQPGKFNAGSPGNGTVGHLTLELYKSMVGADIVHVPYNGDAAAIKDLLGGSLQAIFIPLTSLIPQIEAGAMRGAAILSKARFAGLPEMQTAVEQGVTLEATGWFALVGPAGIARPIVDTLNREVNTLIAGAEGQKQLAQFGALSGGGPPERLTQLLASEFAKWGPVVKAAGVKID
jgi:tripartite-type tricarboxylate transporter receptor subunit TctC